MKLGNEEFVSENIDTRGDIINRKLDQKGPKLVFHIQMVIER